MRACQPGGSFDTIAGKLDNMFDFDRGDDPPLKVFLDPNTGAVVSVSGGRDQDDEH